MIKNYRLFVLIAFMCLASFYACNEQGKQGKQGPIIIGDTATIVTEANPSYLLDIVKDLHPDIPASLPHKDTAPLVKSAVVDTTKQSAASTKKQVQTTLVPETGLHANFADIAFAIPDINIKSGKQKDLSKANGATFQMLDGNLNGKSISITKGNMVRVSQRYQTIIVLKNNLGTLPLETLNYLSDWEELKGAKGNYTISGINGKLEAADFNLASLQRAISKSARKHRISRSLEKQWLNSVRNTRANKKTINIVMRYISWKLDAKDDKGKAISKQIRIDLPTPTFTEE
jgi:hypothetical protein